MLLDIRMPGGGTLICEDDVSARQFLERVAFVGMNQYNEVPFILNDGSSGKVVGGEMLEFLREIQIEAPPVVTLQPFGQLQMEPPERLDTEQFVDVAEEENEMADERQTPVYRLVLYITDWNNTYNLRDVITEIEQGLDAGVHVAEKEVRDAGEWDDDHPLNKSKCDAAAIFQTLPPLKTKTKR